MSRVNKYKMLLTHVMPRSTNKPLGPKDMQLTFILVG